MRLLRTASSYAMVTVLCSSIAAVDASLDPTEAVPVATRVTSAPAFASLVPASTTQVVRTVSTDRWCRKAWCTVTQVWSKRHGAWNRVRVFRSTVAPRGFDKTREGDQRSPSGVYRIKVTFSTGRHPPGLMPWKRRLPTSIVTNKSRRLYNTWIEEPGRTDGDRASMRWGFIVGYNHPRLRPGVGPKPVPGKGYGIFYHTSLDRQSRWTPTKGCTQLGRPAAMRWLVKWLDPAANPRVVQDL
jgi:L,D-peptidoglycan transpeptidase YkuD (ErfK/YbiS/YcfS/YnhG family)